MAKNNRNEGESSHVELVWGSAILDDGFTPMPNMITRNYRRLGMTHGEYSFVSLLATFKHDVNDPYPSQETLAALYFADSYEEGKSERAIRKIVKSLKDKGLLRTGKRRNKASGEWASAVYSLKPLIDACLKLHGNKKEVVETEFDVIWDDESPEEQKVPMVSTQKVPLVQEQKVPTKKKRENNKFKRKEEEELTTVLTETAIPHTEIQDTEDHLTNNTNLTNPKRGVGEELHTVITELDVINLMNAKIKEREITNEKTIKAILAVSSKCKVIGTSDREAAENFVITVLEEKMGKFGQKQKIKQSKRTTRKELLPKWLEEQKNTGAVEHENKGEFQQSFEEKKKQEQADLEAERRRLELEFQQYKK